MLAPFFRSKNRTSVSKPVATADPVAALIREELFKQLIEVSIKTRQLRRTYAAMVRRADEAGHSRSVQTTGENRQLTVRHQETVQEFKYLIRKSALMQWFAKQSQG